MNLNQLIQGIQSTLSGGVSSIEHLVSNLTGIGQNNTSPKLQDYQATDPMLQNAQNLHNQVQQQQQQVAQQTAQATKTTQQLNTAQKAIQPASKQAFNNAELINNYLSGAYNQPTTPGYPTTNPTDIGQGVSFNSPTPGQTNLASTPQAYTPNYIVPSGNVGMQLPTGLSPDTRYTYSGIPQAMFQQRGQS